MDTEDGYLESLLVQAADKKASDVHLQDRDGTICVRLRMDGVLQNPLDVPEASASTLFGRIKYLAKLKTYQERFPQDGRIPGVSVGLDMDIRVSTFPTVDGEKIVLRFFQTNSVASLSELGLPSSVSAQLNRFLALPNGMLLLTGPAGSGKTTTIYACLKELAQHGNRNVVSIEDPVENLIPEIMQSEVNEAIDLTFPTALRHLLRQDPEVIAIGEIRDEETARIAVRAAFTGHLVIATIHAGSCRSVLERLFDMCDDPYAIVSATQLIVNQRLIRKLCGHCSGTGCADCGDSGYHGRVPIADALWMTESLRTLIRKDDLSGLPADGLRASALELAKTGLTTESEVQRLLGVMEGDL